MPLKSPASRVDVSRECLDEGDWFVAAGIEVARKLGEKVSKLLIESRRDMILQLQQIGSHPSPCFFQLTFILQQCPF